MCTALGQAPAGDGDARPVPPRSSTRGKHEQKVPWEQLTSAPSRPGSALKTRQTDAMALHCLQKASALTLIHPLATAEAHSSLIQRR